MRQQEKQLHFHKGKQECDFLIEDRNKVTEAIQVCYDLSHPDTYQREIKGLYEACTKYELTKGTIITYDELKEDTYKGLEIEVVPAYRYFLR